MKSTYNASEQLHTLQYDLENHQSTLNALASVCEETIPLVKKLASGRSSNPEALKAQIAKKLESLEWMNYGQSTDHESEVEMLKEAWAEIIKPAS